MLQLATLSDVLAGIERAKDVTVSAYTLRRPVLQALESAAGKGAHVAVVLERCPYGGGHDGLGEVNARYVSELRACGARANLENGVHSKTIDVDGTLYLDEKNFDAGDLIVRETDSAEAATIPTRKAEALAKEAQVLGHAARRDDAIVESESIGVGNAAYFALRAVARRGIHPRLLVSRDALRRNPRERAVLAHLEADGVRVRVCKDSEKLAVAGKRAWLGSANATYAGGTFAMSDWGVDTVKPPIVKAVRERLERDWAGAKDFVPAQASLL